MRQVIGLPEPGNLSRPPAWIMGIVVALIVLFFIIPTTGVDMLVTYGPAGRGQFIEGYLPRNPRFAIWLFWLFARLPWKWDYLTLTIVSSLLLILATRLGGGRFWKVYLSFPFIWLLAYGQIDAFIALGIALCWWATVNDRPWWLGLGLALTVYIKPQVGLVPALFFWWWSENRWKPLAIPAILGIVSLSQWGWDWPYRWVSATLTQVGVLESDWANASLYQWIGPWALLAWMPVVLLPMDRFSRLRGVMAATAISLPYYPAYQLLIFLPMPVSVIEWLLVQLPLLSGIGYQLILAMPLFVWLMSVSVGAANLRRSNQIPAELIRG